MNVVEWIRSRTMRLLGMVRLGSDPNSGRLTYINDDEAIRLSNIKANRTWYLGDGDELLNWYTNQQTYGWAENPIYNRNKRQYFWGMSVNEAVKRVHSGVPKAVVDTISNVVGMPDITGDPRLADIFEANDFEFMLTQRARPMTLVEGDGCWKVNVNESLCKHPLIEWYGAEDWGPIMRSNVLLGLYFKSYYKDKDGKDYVLFEFRTRRAEGTAIEFRLFKLSKANDIEECRMDTIPELAKVHDSMITGIDSLLAVPLRYYFDPLRPNRGKSVYDGKLDLFDMMDEILTQAGQTNRVSTPVEYYPVDLLERTQKGQPVLPAIYNRQYVKIEATPDGDGNMANQIQTTQPNLDFDRYMALYDGVLSNALIGILSPSSLGIDIAKRDNADAQREKEKQTIFTRNTIIGNETKALMKLCDMLLMAQDYMDYGRFRDVDYPISIKYDEFANPSFESEIQILGPAWSNGQISTERFVAMLWAGKLSDEELAAEAAKLDENRQKDDFDINQLMGEGDAKGFGKDIPGEGQKEKGPEIPQE